MKRKHKTNILEGKKTYRISALYIELKRMRTFCLSVQIFQKPSSSGCLFLFIFYIKEHILFTIESFFTRVLLTAVIGQKRFILANEITERDK